MHLEAQEVLRTVPLELSVEIRLARAEDLPELEWFGALRAHRANIADAFQQQMNGENWMLVADVRGFPVGQIWVDLARKPGIGLLWAFRVMPPFKGLGLGTILLEVAEKMLVRRGIQKAEIGVEPSNQRALRLYRRAGFVSNGDEEVVFETNDERGRHEHRIRVMVLQKDLGHGAEVSPP